MLEALITDLDGTLVKLPIDWDRFYEIMESYVGKKMPFLEFLSKYFATPVFWKLHRVLEELELEACKHMSIYDDAKPFLYRAQSLVKRIAVVTMQSSSACLRIVERLGLSNSLELCVSREVAPTRARQIAYVVELLGLDPRKTLFVGDKVVDGFAAAMNRVNAVVVFRNPIGSKISDTDDVIEDLKSMGIEVVSSLLDAIPIIERIAKAT